MGVLNDKQERQQRHMLQRHWSKNGFNKGHLPMSLHYEPPKEPANKHLILTVQDMEESAWLAEDNARFHIRERLPKSTTQLTPELVCDEVKQVYRSIVHKHGRRYTE